jgi:hypothetical protein
VEDAKRKDRKRAKSDYNQKNLVREHYHRFYVETEDKQSMGIYLMKMEML